MRGKKAMGNLPAQVTWPRENPLFQWMEGLSLGPGGKGSLPRWALFFRVPMPVGRFSNPFNHKKNAEDQRGQENSPKSHSRARPKG